jgi:hypothetical protein
LEHQAEFDAYFDRRMFQYFALLDVPEETILQTELDRINTPDNS